MSNQAVLAEIARLESELARIQRELDSLRKAVSGPSTRRTQAFASVSPKVSPKEAPTREMPATTPPPQPSVAVSSDVVPKAKSDRRVQNGARTGLTDFPPSAEPTPTRRHAAADPDAGRYGYVEGTKRRGR